MLRSARWRHPRTLAVRRRCLTAVPSRCSRRRGRHREIASALPLPDRTHAPGTLESRHRHLQRARRSPDLRRQRRHRLARTSAQHRIEPLCQRHHFLDGSSRCRLRPRSRLRPRVRAPRPRRSCVATHNCVCSRERPLHRRGDRRAVRREVIPHQLLDLLCQALVCRHAIHVARRGSIAQHHP